MGNFSKDGGTEVYLKLSGGALTEIFPLRYSARTSCKFVGSPNEQGMMKFDHKVQMPTVIEFTGVVQYDCYGVLESIYEEILEGKVHRGTFYAKGMYYNNMEVEELEEIGVSERYDGVEIRVKLVEYMEEGATTA